MSPSFLARSTEPMSLLANHGYRVSRLLIRYPSALAKLPRGLAATSAYIDELVKQEYQSHPLVTKRTHGFEICLNPDDPWFSPIVAIIGSYEPDETRIFERVLKSGNKVIDVGANVGWFTLLSAKLVGKEGQVMALEPAPRTFSFLSKSVKKNGFANVVLLNQVASDFDGTATLFLHRDESLGNSIVRDFGRGELRVPSSRIDTLAREHRLDVIDLVKVDAEGAEPQVVSGMLGLIEEGRVRQIVLEWNPNEWAPHPELLSMLFERFDVFSINRLALRPLTKVARDSIPSTLNLFLVKK
jgi:FkbM family methyltransferase